MSSGGIFLVTGKPGHGKSYYGVLQIVEALEANRPVATNMVLTEGWAEQLARRNPARALRAKSVEQRAADYRRMMHTVCSMDDLHQLRLAPCGDCRGCRRSKPCSTEGRGVAVLDEAQMYLNSRMWDVDETGEKVTRAEAVQRRLGVVGFFTHHRKRGWRVYLITQEAGFIDPQVRTLYEQHIHVKNVKRLAAWWNPARLMPGQLFVAIGTWGGDKAVQRLWTKVFKLDKRLARLYETMATHTASTADEIREPIVLGGRGWWPAPVAGASEPEGPPRGHGGEPDPPKDDTPESGATGKAGWWRRGASNSRSALKNERGTSEGKAANEKSISEDDGVAA